MKEKIKVLQFVGDAIKGGVEAIVYSYSEQLKDDVEPTFIFFEGSTYIPEEFIKSIGGKYYIIPHLKHLHKFNKAFSKILKENHFDIIHSHVNTLSVFTLRVAKKCGYKIRIAHSHSQSSKKEFVRNLIKSILKNFSKKYATDYFACGEVAGRYQFGNKTYDEGKVRIIRNATNLDEFAFNDENRASLRKELGVKDNEILVGTIGRLCVTKNQTYILKMAEQLPDTKFVIVGAGPLQEELETFIKERNLKNVILYGMSHEAKKIYSALDTFLLPSLYEGLPVTGIEAQANGVYTLFSDQVPSEAKATSYVKFLPIGDENLSKWVDELKVQHPHENHHQEMVDAGFSIKEASQNLLKIYKELLNK